MHAASGPEMLLLTPHLIGIICQHSDLRCRRRENAMSSRWYSLESLPDLNLVVRVWWAVNGVFESFQAEHLFVDGKWDWMRMQGRRLVLLPPSGRNGHGWAKEPACWQPIDAEKFVWPSGKQIPLAPHMLPIFAGSRQQFKATAEAVEREGNAERNRDADEKSRAIQWWRDVSQVVYEPRGSVTRDMCEARIMRALTLDQMIRMDIAPYRSNAAVLANLKASILDMLDQPPEDDWVPRLDPQPSDHADYLEAMRWLARVGMSHQRWRVMQGRRMSPPLSWVQIAFQIGRTPARARQVYDDMIDRLLLAANAPAMTDRQMEALRERNRAYRAAGRCF